MEQESINLFLTLGTVAQKLKVDKGGLTFILNLMLKMNFIGRKWGKIGIKTAPIATVQTLRKALI